MTTSDYTHRLSTFLLSVTLILLASVETASAARKKNIRFQRISLEQGLSQAGVKSILQDRDGFMWFGTEEGLNRYDGYDFTVFAHDAGDLDSLSHDWVWSLHEDGDGVLWVGTDGGGLNRFNRTDESFTHFNNDPADPSSLSSDRVRIIFEDRSGVLWVGTDGDGLNRFDRANQTFERFKHDPNDPSSLSSDRIRSVFEDRQRIIWIGTDGGGLSKFDRRTRTFTHYRYDPSDASSLSDDRVRSLHEDEQGNLWVGTYDGGLNRFDRSNDSFTHFRHDPADPSSLSANRVRALHEDIDGVLWIGTDAGLNEWNPASETFERYLHDPTNPASLGDNRIASIFQDRGKVLWIATDGGINKWNPAIASFAHYKHDPNDPSQLSDNVVTAFYESRDGELWVGTFGGLDRFDTQTQTFRHYTHDPKDPSSLSDDRVMSLFIDEEGVLWVGTFGGGLNRFDQATETFSHYVHDADDPESLSWNGVTTIQQHRDGTLWVGTFRGGLDRFDRTTDSFVHYRHDADDPSSLSNNNVLAIYEDESGRIWVGTHGGGLSELDPTTGTFSHYRHDPNDPASLSNDRAWTIYEGSTGDLWIGTHGGGLNKWSQEDRIAGRASFTHFKKRDGLLSAVIYGILEDEQGKLWLSTNYGLSQFDPVNETFRHYDTTHGLQSNEFNFAAQYRSQSGEMFFGGILGYNAFYPHRISDNAHAPPVVLTSFLKFNQPVTLDRPTAELSDIELTYKDSVVAFEFAALDYTAPEKNRYMVKLEGFDEDWVDLGNLRRATYTNLDPGNYAFRVKASNNDGVWNENGIRLGIQAAPPPWKTWWAYSLYTLIASAVLFAYNRAQAKKLERSAQLNEANKVLKTEIAERKSKEEALHEEKARAQKYLDVVEVIMLALNHRGEVTLINQKGCQVLGYEEEEIVGRNWFDHFIADGDQDEVRANFQRGEVYEYSEYSVVTKDGHERVVAWHTTFLRDEESRLGTLSSGSDITQVRNLENQLQHSQKMEAIGTLAGGIAHDFNNILASILGYTCISLEDLPEDDPISDNLTHVRKSAERAADLVNQILTFSHQSELERKPVRVQTIVNEALKLLRASLPATIQFRTTIDSDCDPVMTDPTQIHQVLMNLCTNAYHAMREKGGVLDVTLKAEHVDESMKRTNPHLQPGPNVRLTVTDTGQGMTPATLKRVFDPFYTTKKVGEGTGLGLSVVHGIVTRSNGDIRVTSKLGEGTSVQIYLPCCSKIAVTHGSKEEAIPLGQERILFVDDEEEISTMVRMMLERMGYQVTSSTSGTEALATFRRQPEQFDLVITDQTMPKMTGIELAQHIHRIRPNLPVVLASGLGNSKPSEQSIRSYIRKPFIPRELAKVVRLALDQPA